MLYETAPFLEPERVLGMIQFALAVTVHATFASTRNEPVCDASPCSRPVGLTRRYFATGGSAPPVSGDRPSCVSVKTADNPPPKSVMVPVRFVAAVLAAIE